MCAATEEVSESGDDKLNLLEVSFNALSGEYNPKTLRLKGSYQGHLLNILVDSGNTFNIYKPGVAQTLGLPHASIDLLKCVWVVVIIFAASLLVVQ